MKIDHLHDDNRGVAVYRVMSDDGTTMLASVSGAGPGLLGLMATLLEPQCALMAPSLARFREDALAYDYGSLLPEAVAAVMPILDEVEKLAQSRAAIDCETALDTALRVAYI